MMSSARVDTSGDIWLKSIKYPSYKAFVTWILNNYMMYIYIYVFNVYCILVVAIPQLTRESRFKCWRNGKPNLL